MKRFVVVLMMLMVAVTAFAETASERVDRARAERDAAWNEWYNCEMMSLEEFTAEYKKNHFALNLYNNEWSASLSKAFKEYQEEVRQQQKELQAAYEEAEAKYEEAEQAEMDELQAEMDELQVEMEAAQVELQAWLVKLQVEIDELSKDENK